MDCLRIQVKGELFLFWYVLQVFVTPSDSFTTFIHRLELLAAIVTEAAICMYCEYNPVQLLCRGAAHREIPTLQPTF